MLKLCNPLFLFIPIILISTVSNEKKDCEMDEYHTFGHSRSEASDHLSFYMGETPVIYFADDIVSVKDSTDNPLEELDVVKLKDLIQIICDFIIDFNTDHYYNLIKNLI